MAKRTTKEKPAAEAEPEVNNSEQTESSETEERLHRIIENLDYSSDELKKMMAENLGETEKLIKQHPLLSVGVAAGVGLMIGLMLNKGK